MVCETDILKSYCVIFGFWPWNLNIYSGIILFRYLLLGIKTAFFQNYSRTNSFSFSILPSLFVSLKFTFSSNSFILSLINNFFLFLIHTFISPFICPFIHSFMHLFFQWCIYSFGPKTFCLIYFSFHSFVNYFIDSSKLSISKSVDSLFIFSFKLSPFFVCLLIWCSTLNFLGGEFKCYWTNFYQEAYLAFVYSLLYPISPSLR